MNRLLHLLGATMLIIGLIALVCGASDRVAATLMCGGALSSVIAGGTRTFPARRIGDVLLLAACALLLLGGPQSAALLDGLRIAWIAVPIAIAVAVLAIVRVRTPKAG